MKLDLDAIRERLSNIGSSNDGRTGWDDLADLTEMARTDIPALIAEVERARAEIERLRSAELWTNWVYPEGANPEDIQNELMDYHELMDRVSVVYDHVTGGRVSKPETTAEAVIEVVNSHIETLLEEAAEET